uniref:Uncharacterized protein n=1 Tax=Trypanosoma vivax (strain Y486) TaxID=1055687 RepID=G0UAR2_TRYVY|nr:hypothetical protein TVY486_1103810 [Trypanosoma vivax Y486]
MTFSSSNSICLYMYVFVRPQERSWGTELCACRCSTFSGCVRVIMESQCGGGNKCRSVGTMGGRVIIIKKRIFAPLHPPPPSSLRRRFSFAASVATKSILSYISPLFLLYLSYYHVHARASMFR